MDQSRKRCAVEGCTTFVGRRKVKYCDAHSPHSHIYGRKPKDNPQPTGGKTRNTKPNPLRKLQVGNAAKIHEVGIIDSYGERQILRSIFGGGW